MIVSLKREKWECKIKPLQVNYIFHVFPCSKLSIPLFHLSIISVWTSNSTINWTELPLPFSVFCVPSPYRLGQNKYNTTAHLVQNYQFPLHLPAQDGPTTSLCFFVKTKQKHCGLEEDFLKRRLLDGTRSMRGWLNHDILGGFWQMTERLARVTDMTKVWYLKQYKFLG